jgi:hypothetical protein
MAKPAKSSRVIAQVEGSGTPENVWMLASMEALPKLKTNPASDRRR